MTQPLIELIFLVLLFKDTRYLVTSKLIEQIPKIVRDACDP